MRHARNAARALATFLLLGVIAPGALAANDGWVDLFDGRTLDGWHTNPEKIGHGAGGKWSVEDGAIVGEQDPPGNGGILLTDKSFGDFELSIDLKPDWGIDTGLFLRSNDRGQCYQMMVDYHEAGNVGQIYGEGLGGFTNRSFSIFGAYDADTKLKSLTTKPTGPSKPQGFAIAPEKWLATWKVGAWNTAKVRMAGNPPQITTWINGEKVSEFDGENFSDVRYKRREVEETIGDEGHIAVQVHGGAKAWLPGAKCRWKNIRLKPLANADAK